MRVTGHVSPDVEAKLMKLVHHYNVSISEMLSKLIREKRIPKERVSVVEE